MSEHNYLVVSALGHDRPGIVEALTGPIQDANGNIFDSRMTVLGGEFAVLMLVGGSATTISKLEADLPLLQDQLQLTIVTRVTAKAKQQGSRLRSYTAEVIALDHPGIVHKISGFFANRSINIRSMDTDCYNAPHTGTEMFTVEMEVDIPETTSVRKLRDEFLQYCDALNLDATLEPSS